MRGKIQSASPHALKQEVRLQARGQGNLGRKNRHPAAEREHTAPHVGGCRGGVEFSRLDVVSKMTPGRRFNLYSKLLRHQSKKRNLISKKKKLFLFSSGMGGGRITKKKVQKKRKRKV